MIIIYCSRSLKDYTRSYRQIIDKVELSCPVCGGRVRYHGIYTRKPRFGTEKVEMPIIRVRCTDECRRTHAVLPDFLSPHKHYSAAEIEDVLIEAESKTPVCQIDSPADISTIKRWIRTYRRKMTDAAAALKAHLFRVYGRIQSAVDGAGITPLKELERTLKKLPRVESSGFLIGEANIWLSSHRADIFL